MSNNLSSESASKVFGSCLAELYHVVQGFRNNDGTFYVDVQFCNPANQSTGVIKCLVDTTIPFTVITAQDLEKSGLNLSFTKDDYGSSILVDGTRMVAPVHNLGIP
eukprot:TRINITY_DN1458_c0_g1_i2.p1 TRINITY_DN1458_c0_g1~~TRINITY_DN1458_c0_g1_i2.p1  ORF type:complete len:106 (+),score=15.79 TRINITY_DN1458_c0_g1_i2:644-961(+)